MSTFTLFSIIHKISVMIWLGMIPADLIIRSYLKRQFFVSPSIHEEKSIITIWMKILNITGIIGMTGVLLSGIMMVVFSPMYSFFDFSDTANHWLAVKQVIMVVLLILTFGFVIPTGKKLKFLLNSSTVPDETIINLGMENIKKMSLYAVIMSVLIAMNFLLAITRNILS